MNAVEILDRLNPQDIRDRLESLHREQEALKVLLRAALRRGSAVEPPDSHQEAAAR